MLGSMTVSFGADLTNLQSGIGQAQGILKNLGSGNFSGALTGGLTLAGGAALKLGEDSISASGDFQQSMLKIQAEAGVSADQIGGLGSSVKQMAIDVGQKPKDLADGLFFVESAGFAGKQGIDTLRLSAQMAATDLTSTTTVAKGLTTEVKAFGLSTSESAYVSNIMTKAVSDGKITMESYSQSIGKVALTAHGYNVSILDTNAALDTLSNNGFPSAAQAGTSLQNLLVQFDGNTDKLGKHLSKLGIEGFDPVKFKAMNLGDQVHTLNGLMQGHMDQLKTVLGGSRNAAQAFQALSGDTQGYNKALTDLKGAQANGGAETAAFATTQQGFNFQMQKASAATDVMKINLGDALLPVLNNVLKTVTPLTQGFMNWESQTHGLEKGIGAVGTGFQTVATGVQNTVKFGAQVTDFFMKNQVAADILGGVLVGLTFIVIAMNAAAIMTALTAIPELVIGFGAWAAEATIAAIATLAAAWPILLIGAVIALVVVGIILAVQHWGEISHWLQVQWDRFSGWFMGMIHSIGGFFTDRIAYMKTMAEVYWAAIQFIIQDKLNQIKIVVANVGHWLYNTFIQPFVDAKNFIGNILGDIGGMINTAISNAGNIGGSIAHGIGIPGFSSGVENFGGGLALVGEKGPELLQLPRGSSVYPMSSSRSGSAPAGPSSGGGGTIYATFVMNEHEIGHAMAEYQLSQLRSQGWRH
jgi:TP901 family phage tail tape measure protein